MTIIKLLLVTSLTGLMVLVAITVYLLITFNWEE